MKKIHNYSFQKIPQSRIASFDIMSIGLAKHHVVGLLEFDVTAIKKSLRGRRRNGEKVSFNAWLIKTLANSLHNHPEASSFLYGKRKLIIFDSINISIIVEKEMDGVKVPIPLVLEGADKKNIEEIYSEIENAKSQKFTEDDIVLSRKTRRGEMLYYHLPGFLRRMFWRYMLSNPKLAFAKMGNVSITSLGSAGKINGWFIHKSVHPISFGVGSVVRKPVVVDSKIEIREILNMTVLIDHDVMDGAPMVRFLNNLTKEIKVEL